MARKKVSEHIPSKTMIITLVIGIMIRCMEWVSIPSIMGAMKRDMSISGSITKANSMALGNLF